VIVPVVDEEGKGALRDEEGPVRTKYFEATLRQIAADTGAAISGPAPATSS
jgi:hypothetical protein